jgi:hypothetical protein
MNCTSCGAAVPDGAAFCPSCGQAVAAAPPTPPASEATKKQAPRAKGCITVTAIIFGLLVVVAVATPGSNTDSNSAQSDASNLVVVNDFASPDAASVGAGSKDSSDATEEDAGGGGLTFSQMNAARSARQYLKMSGFSRDGLIQQLSSDAGDGYSVSDATAAVDSLDVDWNENAARSARQYLEMTGFSCQGLIEQLSSSAGDKYTREQAEYGASQAGAC